MKIVNLLRHELTLVDEENYVIKIIPPQNGPAARMESDDKVLQVFDYEGLKGLKYVEVIHRYVRNLPDPEPDTLYIVSGLVSASMQERPDVVAPGKKVYSRSVQARKFLGVTSFVKPRPLYRKEVA